MEAFFSGDAFGPHRHDTYAIGMTVTGVKRFTYRGGRSYGTRDDVIAFFPDELHDAGAAETRGLHYRMLHVHPSLIRDALADVSAPLPFVPGALSRDETLRSAVETSLADFDRVLEPIEADGIVSAIATALARMAAPHRARQAALDIRAVQCAREYLDAHALETVSSNDLERASDMSRYELARQFRAALGTSPYRYLVMRRLDRAREMILHGAPLAEAADATGFADQSHLTRTFTRTYGLSPGRWRSILQSAAAP